MDDDAVLIPVDVSGEEETFPTSYEELVEKAIVYCRDEGGFTNKTWGESVGRYPFLNHYLGSLYFFLPKKTWVKNWIKFSLQSYEMNKFEILLGPTPQPNSSLSRQTPSF